MSTQRRGLGRGLGSLIPTGPRHEPAAPAVGLGADEAGSTLAPNGAARANGTGVAGVSGTTADGSAPTANVAGAHFAEVPIEAIRPNSRQPRSVFDEESMAELVDSIREVGLLQPVVVRALGADEYELVMGERRWRACQQAGLDSIPAIVRETVDDDMLRDALLENLHRAQLNPLEEAAAYQQLLDDFGCTHDELAGRIGRSRPQISNTLRLLRLSPAVQRRVAAGVLSAGHARALLGVDDPARQDRLAARVVAEGLSVRAVEEIVASGEEPLHPRAPRPRAVAPGLDDIAQRLEARFETRCRVTLGRRKGRITVEFASLDDLQRILALLDPPGTTAAEPSAVAVESPDQPVPSVP